MNVAKNEGNSSLIKLHEASGSALVETKVKPFSIEQRKNIVEERIVVRELHLPAHRNHHERGLKGLVFLYQLRDVRWVLSRWIDCFTQGTQPDHCIGSIFRFASVPAQLDMRLQGWLRVRGRQT